VLVVHVARYRLRVVVLVMWMEAVVEAPFSRADTNGASRGVHSWLWRWRNWLVVRKGRVVALDLVFTVFRVLPVVRVCIFNIPWVPIRLNFGVSSSFVRWLLAKGVAVASSDVAFKVKGKVLNLCKRYGRTVVSSTAATATVKRKSVQSCQRRAFFKQPRRIIFAAASTTPHLRVGLLDAKEEGVEATELRAAPLKPLPNAPQPRDALVQRARLSVQCCALLPEHFLSRYHNRATYCIGRRRSPLVLFLFACTTAATTATSFGKLLLAVPRAAPRHPPCLERLLLPLHFMLSCGHF
jgi:hypothetical protein